MPSRGVPCMCGLQGSHPARSSRVPLQPPNGPPRPHEPVLCSAARAIFQKHKPDPVAQLLTLTNGSPSCLELLPDFLPRPPDPLPPDSHSCSLKLPGLHSGLLAPPASRPWHLLVPGPGTPPPPGLPVTGLFFPLKSQPGCQPLSRASTGQPL